MNRVHKRPFKRASAFLLALLFAASSADWVGVSTAMAAVMTEAEAEDTISINHQLVSGGEGARISIEEATPEIRIMDVQMLRGTGIVLEAGSRTAVSPSEFKVTPPLLQEATPSFALERATPSESKTAAAPVAKIATASTPHRATAANTDEMALESRLTPELGAKDDGWSFLVDQNGTYRFKVTYQAIEADRLVKKSIAVDYLVSDIFKLFRMNEGQLTISSNIHGEGKEEGLEIPVDRDVTGSLIVQCKFPENARGGYIDIEFPKYVNIVNYPKNNPIDGSRTTVAKRTVDGKSVWTLRAAVLESVTGDIQFQVDYQSIIKKERGLTNEEMEAYASNSLVFGSITAEAFDGNGNSLEKTQIGPITAKWNTGVNGFGLKRRGGGAALDELVVDDYDLESQKIVPYLGSYSANPWSMSYEIGGIYTGASPVWLKQLKIYAPRHFRFDLSRLPGREDHIELGEDEVGHYLIYHFRDLPWYQTRIVSFYSEYSQIYFVLAPGETVGKGERCLAPKPPVLTYVSGEVMEREEPFMAAITISENQYVKADQLKVTNASPLIQGGRWIRCADLLSLSNLGEVRDGINILPQDKLEGAELTIRFPDELFVAKTKITNWQNGLAFLSSQPQEGVVGPTGDRHLADVQKVEGLLSDGRAVEMRALQYYGTRYFYLDTVALPPEDIRFVGFRIKFGSMYRAQARFDFGFEAAVTKEDKSPFPSFGEEPETVDIAWTLDSGGEEKQGAIPVKIQAMPTEDRLKMTGGFRKALAGSFLSSSDSAVFIIRNETGRTGPDNATPVMPKSSLEEETLTISLPEEISVMGDGSGRLMTISKRLEAGIESSYPTYHGEVEINKVEAILNNGTFREMNQNTCSLIDKLAEGEAIRGYRINFKSLFLGEVTIGLAALKVSETKADGTPFSTTYVDSDLDRLTVLGEMTDKGDRKVVTFYHAIRGIAVGERLKLRFNNSSISDFLPGSSWPVGGKIPFVYLSNMDEEVLGQVSGRPSCVLPNHRGEDLEWDMEYPYGICPSSWVFDAGNNRYNPYLPIMIPEADVRKFTLWLDNGDVIEAPLTKTKVRDGVWSASVDASTLIPIGRCVIKSRAVITSLYNVEYRVGISGTMPELRPDGTSFKAESGNVVSELRHEGTPVLRSEQKYKITPPYVPEYACGQFTANVYSPSRYSTSLLQDDAESGYLRIGYDSTEMGKLPEGVNPVLEFHGQDLLNALNGTIDISSVSHLAGWKIEYETSMGRNGVYSLPDHGYYYDHTFRYALLSAGENFIRVKLRYDGIFRGGIANDYGPQFNLTTTSEMRHHLPRVPDAPSAPNTSLLSGFLVDRGEYEGQQDRTQAVSIQLYAHASTTLKAAGMTATLDAVGYQGTVINATLSPKYQVNLMGMPNGMRNFPWGNEVYYIEWLGGNDFALKDTQDSPYEYSFVRTADGAKVYLKVTPKEAGLNSYGANSGLGSIYNGSVFASKSISASFLIMPGTSTGIHPLLGKTYVDTKGYEDRRSEVERLSGVLVDVSGATADLEGICQDGDVSTNRLLLLSANERSTTVNLNNVTGITSMLGVDQAYQGQRLKFSPNQRKHLNVAYSVSSDQDLLLGYEIVVPIPKKGSAITYRKDDGTLDEAVSQFNMALRGPATFGGTSAEVEATYQLGTGGYVSESDVRGGWDQVTSVRFYIDRFGSGTGIKPAMNVFLDLEAEEKSGDTLMEAYLSPRYRFKTSDGMVAPWLYGSLSVFIQGNYELSGVAWNDRNENGIREPMEEMLKDITIQLFNEEGLLSETKTAADGSYELETYRSEGLYVKVLVPRTPEAAEDMVLTKPLKKLSTGMNISYFIRPEDGDLSYGTVDLYKDPAASKSNLDVGLCYLPKLTVADVDVKSRQSAQAQAVVTVKYGSKPGIQYDEAEDPSVAYISSDGRIKAQGVWGNHTTAKAWVSNSLGDRVEAQYAIRIFSNHVPVIRGHDWGLVEGDQVADWFNGVTVEDLEDTFLPTAEPLDSHGTLIKNITFHREAEAGEADVITQEQAISQPGTSYIRYSALDEDGNEGVSVVKLSVYGKLESRPGRFHHMVTEEGLLAPEENAFYYRKTLDGPPIYVPGSNLRVIPEGTKLNEAGSQTVKFLASHGGSGLTTEGVVFGDGRSKEVEDVYYVDGRPEIRGAVDLITLTGDVLELLPGVDASYFHYGADGSQIRNASVTVSGPDGSLLPEGRYTAPETAGLYTLTYHANGGETYENGQNTSQKEIALLVCGSVEVEAPERLYLTPQEGKSEGAVLTRLRPQVKGYYNDPVTGSRLDVEEAGLIYDVTMSRETEMAVSVGVRASYVVEGRTIWSEERLIPVSIRNVPEVVVSDVALRQGQAFDPLEGVALSEVDPEGMNEISLLGTADMETVGRYTLTYQARDPLTQAHTTAVRQVYVQGNPRLVAFEASLYTHQSTEEGDLARAVKSGNGVDEKKASASVQYVDGDGTVRTEDITEAIRFQMAEGTSYEPETEGRYKMVASVTDGGYLPAGCDLPAAEATLLVAVTVSNKLYQVNFITNNDDSHHKGEFEGGEEVFHTNAIHGRPAFDIPVPTSSAPYHFDGFLTRTPFSTTQEVVLVNGTAIPAGIVVRAGALLTRDELQRLKLYADVEFQAYFSTAPLIEGKNAVIYQGESYDRNDLHIQVTDLDGNANPYVVDDGSVNTNIPGTYQCKASVNDPDGNFSQVYLYVQVMGKTRFIAQPDLHIRNGVNLTQEELLGGLEAVYEKPADIPAYPWPEAEKVNGGSPAVTTRVAIQTTDTAESGRIQRLRIHYTAPGMILGRESAGEARGERSVYIHGMPVISLADNGLYTHQSTSPAVLQGVIRTGRGLTSQNRLAAYVDYALPDGSVKRVSIPQEEISVGIEGYVPLTAGEYVVTVRTDDTSVLSQALAPGLEKAAAQTQAKITVADKMYSVGFDTGGHGGFLNSSESMALVAHGKMAALPQLWYEEGYELGYWSDEGGRRIDLSSTVITADRRFRANFKVQEFTVRFIGKRNRVIKSQIVEYGRNASPPASDRDVTTRKFNGWSGNYRNVKSDRDIYTTYWKYPWKFPVPSGDYVAQGPGVWGQNAGVAKKPMTETPMTPLLGRAESVHENVPVFPPSKPVLSPAVLEGFPEGEDAPDGTARLGYRAELVDGTKSWGAQGRMGFVTQSEQSFSVPVPDKHDHEKCVFYVFLLILALIEFVYYLYKREKDKKELEDLERFLREKGEGNV